jgi:hypothetical protein
MLKYLKPMKGKKIPDPFKGTDLPEEGAWVEYGKYWMRRLRFKEVEESEPAKKPAPKSTSKATKEA